MATLLALVCPMALSSILLYHCNAKFLQVIFNFSTRTGDMQPKQTHLVEIKIKNVIFALALQSPTWPFNPLEAGEHE